jgi:hypothetical protein
MRQNETEKVGRRVESRQLTGDVTATQSQCVSHETASDRLSAKRLLRSVILAPDKGDQTVFSWEEFSNGLDLGSNSRTLPASCVAFTQYSKFPKFLPGIYFNASFWS